LNWHSVINQKLNKKNTSQPAFLPIPSITSKRATKKQKTKNTLTTKIRSVDDFTFYLPSELNLKIFSYFTIKQLLAVATVSKNFKNISEDPSLWRELYFPMKNLTRNEDNILKILQKSDIVRHIKLGNCPYITDKTLQAIIPKNQYLRELELISNLKLNVSLITQVCGTHLEVLVLSSKTITDDALTTIIINNPNLSSVSIACPLITPIIMQPILNLGTQLTTFSLFKMNLNFNDFNDQVALTLLKNCPNMRILFFFGWNISNITCESIQKYCPRLEELNISCCDKITILKPLLQCPRLKTIDIYGLSEEAIKKYAESSDAQLEDLSIGGAHFIDTPLVKLFLKNFKQLKRLHFVKCDSVTNETVSTILMEFKALPDFSFEDCFNVSMASKCLIVYRKFRQLYRDGES